MANNNDPPPFWNQVPYSYQENQVFPGAGTQGTATQGNGSSGVAPSWVVRGSRFSGNGVGRIGSNGLGANGTTSLINNGTNEGYSYINIHNRVGGFNGGDQGSSGGLDNGIIRQGTRFGGVTTGIRSHTNGVSRTAMDGRKLVILPEKVLLNIFNRLEARSTVALALTSARIYNVYRNAIDRQAYPFPFYNLYAFDAPWTPTKLLYVMLKDFMGPELHFCYRAHQFVLYSRRGMTIEEKKNERCIGTATVECGLLCADSVGPLTS